MKLLRHKFFAKQYKKLDKNKRLLVDEAIFLFVKNPFDKKLRNHQLKGKYSNCNSIDASFDLRIILIQEENYATVLLLKVGSHNKLY